LLFAGCLLRIPSTLAQDDAPGKTGLCGGGTARGKSKFIMLIHGDSVFTEVFLESVLSLAATRSHKTYRLTAQTYADGHGGF
jgi:hypothetical protein